MICDGIWFLSNQLCVLIPEPYWGQDFNTVQHDTCTRKLTYRWISPPQKGICKMVRNARLTGFQTMYTINSALDLVGSNKISIDLGSSSFTMVVKHSFVRYTWNRNYKLYLKVDLHLHCNHKLGYHCRTGQ